MTDEDANNMTHKDGSKKPGYNHQGARDGEYGVVTADCAFVIFIYSRL